MSLFDRRDADNLLPDRRKVSRRVYAFGVLNTATDRIVSLLLAEDKTTAHIEAGERNWRTDSDLHVVIPLVAAPRSGTFPEVRDVA